MMPKLIPREQWICDTCGEVIRTAKEGYLEFVRTGDEDNKVHSFRIAHISPFSPRNPDTSKPADRPEHSCLRHAFDRHAIDGGFHLDRVVGPDGFPVLLAMIDRGPVHQPQNNGPNVVSLREWTELVRRLALPYYEEARLYWTQAEQSGWWEGGNEFYIYSENVMKRLIEEFEPKDDDITPLNRR